MSYLSSLYREYLNRRQRAIDEGQEGLILVIDRLIAAYEGEIYRLKVRNV